MCFQMIQSDLFVCVLRQVTGSPYCNNSKYTWPKRGCEKCTNSNSDGNCLNSSKRSVCKLSLSPFRLFCIFTNLVQSVATMIAVVVVQIFTVLTGRWRSIDLDRHYRPLSTGHSPVHSTGTCAGLRFRDSFGMFFAYKKLLDRTETRTCERKDFQSIRTV